MPIVGKLASSRGPSGSQHPTGRDHASPSPALSLAQHGYVLEKTLGNGAYAKVKQAHAIKINKKVAIKIVDRKKAPKDVLNKFMPRELTALRQLSGHDNIVQLHDIIMTDDKIYIVMELAENGDLLDYINAKKRLSERTARSFYRDLISGITVCHKKDIVHRDLKCENLLLDGNYRLKLSDFGFARSYTGQPLETYCGSCAYAAPEVILGQPYNGVKSDIWSTGVILYAMVCGRLPFNDKDSKTLLAQVSQGLTFPSDVSASCRDLITKLLASNTKERLSVPEILQHPWMRRDPEGM